MAKPPGKKDKEEVVVDDGERAFPARVVKTDEDNDLILVEKVGGGREWVYKEDVKTPSPSRR